MEKCARVDLKGTTPVQSTLAKQVKSLSQYSKKQVPFIVSLFHIKATACRWGKWAELWFSLRLQRSVTQDDISVVGLWDSNSSCGRGCVLQLLAPSRRLDPTASPQRSSNAPRTFPQQPSFSSSHYVSLRQLGPFGKVSQKKAGLSVYQSQFAIYSTVRWGDGVTGSTELLKVECSPGMKNKHQQQLFKADVSFFYVKILAV